MIKWNQCSASARMLINERHFKQHQLRQSVVPSHSPESLYLFFAELQKPDAWPGDQQISAPGTVRGSALALRLWLGRRSGHRGQGLRCRLHPAPSEGSSFRAFGFSLSRRDPASKGEGVLVPPKLSRCPWHDARGCCPIPYGWQFKRKHTVMFLDETAQTFPNSLCVQPRMLSERTTHTHGIYGKCWEIWKEILWEVSYFFEHKSPNSLP